MGIFCLKTTFFVKYLLILLISTGQNGRLTHFLPSPEVGHDFHKVTVTQQLGQSKITGSQMKDMDFVFPQIRFGLL